jgi:hypothetical protein
MFPDVKGTPFRYTPTFPANRGCGDAIEEIASAIFAPGGNFGRIAYSGSANRHSGLMHGRSWGNHFVQ